MSNLTLPTTERIRARAVELLAMAERHGDTAAVSVLTRVRDNIDKGARLTWDMYDLHVTSANTPGAQYTVSCGVCDCPAWKPCWHIGAYELAIELLDDASGDADYELDADDPEPPTTPPFVLSDYAIQRFVVGPMVERARRAIEAMRAQQGRTLGTRLALARRARWAA